MSTPQLVIHVVQDAGHEYRVAATTQANALMALRDAPGGPRLRITSDTLRFRSQRHLPTHADGSTHITCRPGTVEFRPVGHVVWRRFTLEAATSSDPLAALRELARHHPCRDVLNSAAAELETLRELRDAALDADDPANLRQIRTQALRAKTGFTHA
ncbi:MAG: hypothetical protein E7K72_22760 [Roseomonas mucosa]|nr:hypothetical protein [Roseomonas mucosa]